MRFVLLVFGLALNCSVYGQSTFRATYNKWFPNNKALRIERLQIQNDSLLRLNDSLNGARMYTIDKINFLKREVTNVKTLLFEEQHKVQKSQDSLHFIISGLRDTINVLSYPIVTCKEEVVEEKGKKDQLVNTCLWRMYKIIEVGNQDAKGQYNWQTQLFIVQRDSLLAIDSKELFKPEKVSELEAMVNQRLEEDFKILQQDEPLCFKNIKSYPSFKLKDMRISFNDHSEVSFEVDYKLLETCYAVSVASTSLRIQELKSFFIEQ
jgi:hypothetical protein